MLGIALALLAAIGAATGAALWPDDGADRRPAQQDGKAKTVTVASATLSDNLSLDGTLGYGAPRSLHHTGGGRVTWLPAVGATVKRGQAIWRVDDHPVVLFYGDTPLFRPLDKTGLVGRDVRVIADHLRSLGYDTGAQPAEGSWVRNPTPSSSPEAPAAPSALPSSPPPNAASDAPADGEQPLPSPSLIKVRKGDAVLTTSLVAAIKRWQRTQDVDQSGVILPGDALVTTGAVRIGKVLAQVGDETTTDLVSVTSTRKQVTVPVAASDAGAIRKGARVRVTLPDERRVDGTVDSIGTVVQGNDADTSGQGSNPLDGRITVTVSLGSDNAVQRLNAAPVKVDFPGRTKRGVLAVPVEALLALSEGGYALRTTEGRLVPVTTGMFAKGMVEVTGPGIRPGLRVETAS
ncbi:hypothetical protein [Streptomyces sp. NBC_00568]|uniref:hypothetical protein n=1 Tax=Streptomyces sp. NBC_00568 TaxID=2975779 RepID=UPI002256318A|nr:hypothetical protein [Streptomyces sp. NBC_00568]MCX4993624.1 hypothetical protein [Streptomyces sp. NBC_00568]